jgi:hypothetical protein
MFSKWASMLFDAVRVTSIDLLLAIAELPSQLESRDDHCSRAKMFSQPFIDGSRTHRASRDGV